MSTLKLIAGATLCGIWVLPSSTSAAQPPVAAIAFAPDGKSVAVGSQSGVTVHSWPDLELVDSFSTSVVNVHDLAFSPDGQLLAIAGGTPSDSGIVELLEWPKGESAGVFRGHEDSVLAVAWQNGGTLATASLDHDVALWDVSSGQVGGRLKGHSRGVSAVCFLGDGPLLVSGGLDQNLRVWDTQSRQMVRTLNNHTREVHQIAERPGDTGLPMVASVSGDRTVRLWQPTIGRMVRFAQLKAIPLAVTWLLDGSRVAVAATDGRVRLIDPDTVEIVGEIPAVDGWAYSLATHPFDGTLLVGGRNGQLKRVQFDKQKDSNE